MGLYSARCGGSCGGELAAAAVAARVLGSSIPHILIWALRGAGHARCGGRYHRDGLCTPHVVDKVEEYDQRLAQHDGQPEEDVADLLAAQGLGHPNGEHLSET